MTAIMILSLSAILLEDDYTSQSVSFPEFCSLARSAGYDGVELRHTQITPETPAAACNILLGAIHDAGLRVTCLTARGLPPGDPERDSFFDRYLDLCERMECGLLKIGGDPCWLREAAERAAHGGIALASNNHIGTPLGRVESTKRYLDEVGHPNFGLLYDSLHLMVAGEDYLGCIPELHGVTRNILVHSVRRAEPGEHCTIERYGLRWTPGLPDEQGVQDWRAIFSSFKRLGYDGLITVVESGRPIGRRVSVARHCSAVVRELWSGGVNTPL